MSKPTPTLTYSLSKNVKIDYEMVYKGDLDAALNASDRFIAICVNKLVSEKGIIKSVSFGGADKLNREQADCTVLEATGTEQACAPVAGILLATFVPDKIDFYGTETRVINAVSKCMGDFVAEDDNIVDIKFVDDGINVGRISVLQEPESPSDGSRLSPGGIAGVSLLGLAVVAGVGLLAARRRRKNKEEKKEEEEEEEENEKEIDGDDINGDIEAGETFEEETVPDSPPKEFEKKVVTDELDDVLFSIETDMKVQQNPDNGDEFEVAL